MNIQSSWQVVDGIVAPDGKRIRVRNDSARRARARDEQARRREQRKSRAR
jgi:hypothetical protein